jgi:hypothetical protein
MPILEAKKGGGYVAKATINKVVVTFHLTAFGQKRLVEAGIEPGRKFPLALLADLAKEGHAWTPPSVAEKSGLNWAQQYDLNLAGDEAAERLFATCTDCPSYDDLHLVAWESKRGSTAKLLCSGCRGALPERFTLSVPLPLLSVVSLTQLEAQGKLPPGSAVVSKLRESMAADMSATWQAFRRQKSQRQERFDLQTPGELELR